MLNLYQEMQKKIYFNFVLFNADVAQVLEIHHGRQGPMDSA